MRLRRTLGWLASALGVLACRDSHEAPGTDPTGAASDMRAGGDGSVELRLAGDPAALSGGARLEVQELNPVVNLVVTAVYSAQPDDLLQFQMALEGVKNSMGFHSSDLGAIGAPAYAVAYLDRTTYASHAGTLDVTLEAGGAIQGSFDTSVSRGSPGGADQAATPSDSLNLSGRFQGSWSLVCRSPVIGLPGDHNVSDSPYCNHLEF